VSRPASRLAVGAAALAAILATAPVATQQATVTNSLGMELVLVQPGTFTVGRFQPAYAKPPDPNAPPDAAPAGRRGGRGGPPPTADEYRRIEEAWRKDASHGFQVTIERPYYIGKYEVTQAQYLKVMGTNPSLFKGALVTDAADDHPVDSVSWSDAQAFVRKLNQLEKTTAYRVPTEFEWEWAARAGADDDIAWADRRPQAFNSGQTTQAVGKMQPNKAGLYDMLGNVWEWVADSYNEKLFADPKPSSSGRQHVLKGGSFVADVANLSYTTHAGGPGNTFDVGFRIVREIR
jgi:formylglycine-generating enzyme